MHWQIHAQDWAVNLLREHVSGAKLRHAYLFTGPEGVGRRSLALRFAQAINCTNPPERGAYCDACRDCRRLATLTHPDLSLLQPEEGHKDIRIDQVRSLQQTLALSPYTGAYRIALLIDFQRATTQAANALLKTLEEPPNRVILLLTAIAPEGLLPTIVSRCEVIRMRPASIDATRDYLHADRGLDAEQALLLAHISGGRIGTAMRLAEDPSALANRRTQFELLLALLPAQRYQRFKHIDGLLRKLDKPRQKISEVLSTWLSFWRDVFLRASGELLPLVNVDLIGQIEQVALQVPVEAARELIIVHEQALQSLEANANIQLLLEALLLQYPRVTVSQTLADTGLGSGD
ncbi:MAG: DNA polymerase III subunit delta' [Chloroflexi bacterium]|jgi:DNA polymerase-3 subunit delta'|nr:DNA polymerase III subunit delta' [Chloroflexota bacterium]